MFSYYSSPIFTWTTQVKSSLKNNYREHSKTEKYSLKTGHLFAIKQLLSAWHIHLIYTYIFYNFYALYLHLLMITMIINNRISYRIRLADARLEAIVMSPPFSGFLFTFTLILILILSFKLKLLELVNSISVRVLVIFNSRFCEPTTVSPALSKQFFSVLSRFLCLSA